MSDGLTDSHCHLDPDVYGGDDGVDAVIARARAAGVARMVTIGSGYEPACLARAAGVASRHPDVWFTVGVHPHDAKHWTDDVASAIRAHAAHPRCVAIGEMGLDFHYDMSPRDEQRACFRSQIRLALDVKKPIVIHDRESNDETFATLVEEGAFTGTVLFHCFTGTVPAMQAIVAKGGFISIPGIVTFKNADVMRDVARACPLDRLLVETDSPFLTPIPHRGKKNEPAYVALVADKVAELRGLARGDLVAATATNTTRVFGLAST